MFDITIDYSPGMPDEFHENRKILSKGEGWLRVAIDNEYINYQKYSTFKNIEKIGKGAMGKVYKAISTCYGTTVALKKFTKFTVKEFVNEVNFLIKKILVYLKKNYIYIYITF
jgi:serine/threonine protein kinase